MNGVCKKMRKKMNGFTLLEVVITLTVLGIIAGLAVPSYLSSIESARTNEARVNLNVIHMGQKLFRLNNGQFWNGGATTVPNANTALGTDMSAVFYTTINVTSNGAALPSSYTATLTRNLFQGGDGATCFRYTFTDGNAAPAPGGGGCQ